jgi:hypothetical protein
MPYHWVQRNVGITGPAVEAIEANGEEIVAVFVQSDHFDLFTRKLGTITDDGAGVVFKPVQQVMEVSATRVTPVA